MSFSTDWGGSLAVQDSSWEAIHSGSGLYDVSIMVEGMMGNDFNHYEFNGILNIDSGSIQGSQQTRQIDDDEFQGPWTYAWSATKLD